MPSLPMLFAAALLSAPQAGARQGAAEPEGAAQDGAPPSGVAHDDAPSDGAAPNGAPLERAPLERAPLERTAPPGTAPTSPPELELLWKAPDGCPARSTVIARVERLLRRPLGDAGEFGTLHVDATLQPAWNLALTISTTGAGVQRTFAGPACETLAETVAVLIAISLDPDVEILQPTSPQHDSDSDAVPRPPHATCEDPPRPRPFGPIERRVALLAGGSGAMGVAPGLAPGVTGAIALLWPSARIQARIDHWFARTVDAPGTGNAAGRISWTTGSARVCLTPSLGIVDFPQCVGFVAGRMRGVGRGLDRSDDASLLFLGADLGPSVAVAPRMLGGRLAFVLGIDAVFAITRPGFFVDDLGLVSRVTPVVGRATLGLELRLPRLGSSAGSGP